MPKVAKPDGLLPLCGNVTPAFCNLADNAKYPETVDVHCKLAVVAPLAILIAPEIICVPR